MNLCKIINDCVIEIRLQKTSNQMNEIFSIIHNVFNMQTK